MGVVGLLGAVMVGRWWMNVFQGRTKIAPNGDRHDAQAFQYHNNILAMDGTFYFAGAPFQV